MPEPRQGIPGRLRWHLDNDPTTVRPTAAGDNVTDDTAAIIAKATAAGAIGGKLFFAPGTYRISTIALTTPQHWVGGKGVIIKRTNTASDLYLVSSTADFTCEGITFDGKIGRAHV